MSRSCLRGQGKTVADEDGVELGCVQARLAPAMAINQILDKEGKFNFDKSQIGFCKLKLMTVECPAFATVYCIVLNYMQTHTHAHTPTKAAHVFVFIHDHLITLKCSRPDGIFELHFICLS